MQEYEMEAVIQAYEAINRTGWEQTRTISYITAQCNSTKRIKPTDILKFSWDKEKEDEPTDWDEIKEIRNQIKSMQNDNNRAQSNVGTV